MNRQPAWWEVVAGVAFLLGLIAAFLVPWSEFWTWFAKNKAPAEVFAYVVTPVGALAAVVGVALNGIFATRTLRQAKIAELGSQFQKGAELIAEAKTAVAGVAMLRTAAFEAPKTYRAATLSTLTNFIAEAGSANPAIVTLRAKPTEAYRAAPPPIDRAALAAILALGRVMNSPQPFDDPLSDLISGKYPVTGLYLHNAHIHDAPLRNLSIEGVVGSVVFRRCDFANSTLQLAYLRHISFIECDFRGAHLSLRSGSGNIGMGLRFRDCLNVAQANFNAEPLSEYLDRIAEEDEREAEEMRAIYGDEPVPPY